MGVGVRGAGKSDGQPVDRGPDQWTGAEVLEEEGAQVQKASRRVEGPSPAAPPRRGGNEDLEARGQTTRIVGKHCVWMPTVRSTMPHKQPAAAPTAIGYRRCGVNTANQGTSQSSGKASQCRGALRPGSRRPARGRPSERAKNNRPRSLLGPAVHCHASRMQQRPMARQDPAIRYGSRAALLELTSSARLSV